MTNTPSPGAQLAAMRPKEEKTCPECGFKFVALVCAKSTCIKCQRRENLKNWRKKQKQEKQQ